MRSPPSVSAEPARVPPAMGGSGVLLQGAGASTGRPLRALVPHLQTGGGSSGPGPWGVQGQAHTEHGVSAASAVHGRGLVGAGVLLACTLCGPHPAPSVVVGLFG